jgi:SET domain-containing protein
MAEPTDVEVRPSGIEGLGVFALRSYAAGERIRRVNIVREVTKDAPLREDLGERIEHCAYPSGKIVLWGFPDRHVNHSCDPNAYALEEGDGSRVVYMTARRPIAAGEEITFDYNVNLSGGSSWPCRRGAKRCAGETIGDFFKLPRERQVEYLPLLAGWFIEMHRARIDALRREASARR